ncbi:CYTH domain-containing protein [Prevotella dentasini]|uniref:CYTH domain-containing protein n=1 Tax=Prevotella dentasini TaxID=589537 RepID=UPI0004695FDD|nr:CYTH domain-containing protein [Prevotella dentasini]
MSGQEIERKFLVHKSVDWKAMAKSSSRIRQGYFDAVNTVRIRIRDDRGYLTIKGPSRDGGLSRYEFEREITLREAEELMQLCEPGIIEKRRYLIDFGGHTFEVDEFHGDNEGLVMAEVELSDESESFDRPAFLGQEVTGDRRFYNSHMRCNPFSLWRGTLPEEYR